MARLGSSPASPSRTPARGAARPAARRASRTSLRVGEIEPRPVPLLRVADVDLARVRVALRVAVEELAEQRPARALDLGDEHERSRGRARGARAARGRASRTRRLPPRRGRSALGTLIIPRADVAAGSGARRERERARPAAAHGVRQNASASRRPAGDALAASNATAGRRGPPPGSRARRGRQRRRTPGLGSKAQGSPVGHGTDGVSPQPGHCRRAESLVVERTATKRSGRSRSAGGSSGTAASKSSIRRRNRSPGWRSESSARRASTSVGCRKRTPADASRAGRPPRADSSPSYHGADTDAPTTTSRSRSPNVARRPAEERDPVQELAHLVAGPRPGDDRLAAAPAEPPHQPRSSSAASARARSFRRRCRRASAARRAAAARAGRAARAPARGRTVRPAAGGAAPRSPSTRQRRRRHVEAERADEPTQEALVQRSRSPSRTDSSSWRACSSSVRPRAGARTPRPTR